MADARLKQRSICALAMWARLAIPLRGKKKPYRKIVVAFKLWVILIEKLFGGVVGRGRRRTRSKTFRQNAVAQVITGGI